MNNEPFENCSVCRMPVQKSLGFQVGPGGCVHFECNSYLNDRAHLVSVLLAVWRFEAERFHEIRSFGRTFLGSFGPAEAEALLETTRRVHAGAGSVGHEG